MAAGGGARAGELKVDGGGGEESFCAVVAEEEGVLRADLALVLLKGERECGGDGRGEASGEGEQKEGDREVTQHRAGSRISIRFTLRDGGDFGKTNSVGRPG